MVQKLPKGMRPLKPKGDPYSDAVRAKQKGSASAKRKLAQKISSIPRMNPENLEKNILEIVRNPEASALQIQKVIGDVLDDEHLNIRTKVELIGKMVQAHTAIHGAKSQNLNLNVDVKLEDVVDKWRKMREKIVVEKK